MKKINHGEFSSLIFGDSITKTFICIPCFQDMNHRVQNKTNENSEYSLDEAIEAASKFSLTENTKIVAPESSNVHWFQSNRNRQVSGDAYLPNWPQYIGLNSRKCDYQLCHSVCEMWLPDLPLFLYNFKAHTLSNKIKIGLEWIMWNRCFIV